MLTKEQYSTILSMAKPFLVVYAIDEDNDWGYSLFIVEPSGAGIIRMTIYKETPNVCMFSDFNVVKSRRNNRFGTSIIDLAEKIAVYLGIEKIQLYAVDKSWVGGWYERIGYVKLKDVSDFEEPEFPDQSIMQKLL